jgi:hypothetical protein
MNEKGGAAEMPREPVTRTTIQAVAAGLADVPAPPEKAESHAAVFEPLMAMIAGLRSLPLKEMEPAVLYAAEEGEAR